MSTLDSDSISAIADAVAARLKPPPRYRSVKQWAEAGLWTEQSLCTFIREGRGPRSIKTGGYRLISDADWAAWVEAGGPGGAS